MAGGRAAGATRAREGNNGAGQWVAAYPRVVSRALGAVMDGGWGGMGVVVSSFWGVVPLNHGRGRTRSNWPSGGPALHVPGGRLRRLKTAVQGGTLAGTASSHLGPSTAPTNRRFPPGAQPSLDVAGRLAPSGPTPHGRVRWGATLVRGRGYAHETVIGKSKKLHCPIHILCPETRLRVMRQRLAQDEAPFNPTASASRPLKLSARARPREYMVSRGGRVEDAMCHLHVLRPGLPERTNAPITGPGSVYTAGQWNMTFNFSNGNGYLASLTTRD